MAKLHQLISPLIFLFVFLVINTSRGEAQSGWNENKAAAIDSFFLDHVEKGKLAGAVTLIVRDNKTEHLKTYGYLDIEQAIPMNTNVIIPIASMTKMITSIAVMQLEEQNKLRLDDPVGKYIPAFKNLPPITIRDLMRHTAGIVYSGGKTITDSLYKEAGFRDWNAPLPLFIEQITSIPLACPPGTRWQYGYSHDVLGYLIEVVSGKTLDIFFREYIFDPLGLEDTAFYIPREKSGRLSNLYIYKEGILTLADDRTNSIYTQRPEALSGGGGWWDSYCGIITTVTDFRIMADMMLHFGKYNGIQILSRESVEAMIKNQLADLPDENFSYGLGVGVTTSKDDPHITEEIYWAGSPYNTHFWINYKENRIGILFTNTAPYGHLGMMNTFKKLAE